GARRPGRRAATTSAPVATETIASLVMNHRITIKGRGCGAFDFYRQQLALVSLAAVEHDDVVGTGAAQHPLAGFLAAAFDKNLDSLADERRMFPVETFVENGK